MKKSERTCQRLLDVAGRQFQQDGYSACSLRNIAGEAGVDVALIAHYFGNKRGLFEAVLADLLGWAESVIANDPDPLSVLRAEFSQPADPAGPARLGLMVLANARDREIGALVRSQFQTRFSDRLTGRLSGRAGPVSVSLVIALLLGLVQGRDALNLPDLVDMPALHQAGILDHLCELILQSETAQPAAAQTGDNSQGEENDKDSPDRTAIF